MASYTLRCDPACDVTVKMKYKPPQATVLIWCNIYYTVTDNKSIQSPVVIDPMNTKNLKADKSERTAPMHTNSRTDTTDSITSNVMHILYSLQQTFSKIVDLRKYLRINL